MKDHQQNHLLEYAYIYSKWNIQPDQDLINVLDTQRQLIFLLIEKNNNWETETGSGTIEDDT